MTITELEIFLNEAAADFELIKQDAPIYTVADGEKYYDINKVAPSLILQSEKGLILCIVSENHGRLDFEKTKEKLGFTKLKMADSNKIEAQTGFKVGTIPLIGLKIPCILDDKLLKFDYIYGGSGDELTTLKINPNDVKRLNNVIASL